MPASAADFTLAVDASWLREGGIGRMAREVLARAPNGVNVEEIRADGACAGLLTPIDLALKASAAKADVIWSPGFIPPLLKAPRKKFFITIHDLTHLHLYTKKHKFYYDVVIRPLLANVDLIFTCSDYSRHEIIEWASLSEDKVERIYYGVSKDFLPPLEAAKGDAPPYILYVGNRRKNKNLERLIIAFARSGLAERGYRLWLTGGDDGETSAWAAREGVREALQYLGHVSDTQLVNLYQQARALAFVSLYEGFGLPVVEAMASGCPVLTSNTTSLGEIGGQAALTVDPTNLAAIAVGLNRICLDEGVRAKLRTAGLARAAQFRWDACAAQFWKRLMGG